MLQIINLLEKDEIIEDGVYLPEFSFDGGPIRDVNILIYSDTYIKLSVLLSST